METYEVMRGLLDLIGSQINCITMRLPVATVAESEYSYNTIDIQLKEGSKFAIQIWRLKDGALV